MQQILHLLVFDPDRRTVLASWHQARWVLPIVCCREGTRAGLMVREWLANQGLPGVVIGQWLGRLSPEANGVDWLMVVTASAHPVADPMLCWTSIESAKSSEAVSAYQQWAVAKATSQEELPRVPGPFGSPAWLDEVKAWIRRAASLSGAAAITSYRATPYEVVLGVSTSHGRVYVKGLSVDRAMEARITRALSELLPCSFARTIALDYRHDGSVWWATEECAGATLVQRPTLDRATRAIAACAHLQRQVAGYLNHDRRLALLKVDLARLSTWGMNVLRHSCHDEAVRAYCAAIVGACGEVEAFDVVHSLIPADLDPANLLVTDGAVRFIDLDEAHVGPAPLAAATLVQRMARAQQGHSPQVIPDDALYATYECAWQPRLQIAPQWPAFEVVSMLLGAYLGWTRVVKKTERGELYGVLGLARQRTAERLVRAVSGKHTERWSHSKR